MLLSFFHREQRYSGKIETTIDFGEIFHQFIPKFYLAIHPSIVPISEEIQHLKKWTTNAGIGLVVLHIKSIFPILRIILRRKT